VSCVSSGASCIVGEKARIARGIGASLRTMACVAREHAFWCCVAVGASGRPGSSRGDAGGTSGGAVMATPTRVSVVGVEHGTPPAATQQLAMPRIRARIDDARRMHCAAKRGRPRTHPSHDERPLAFADDAAVSVGAERGHDGRLSACRNACRCA
jgi:hypothetical protein